MGAGPPECPHHASPAHLQHHTHSQVRPRMHKATARLSPFRPARLYAAYKKACLPMRATTCLVGVCATVETYRRRPHHRARRQCRVLPCWGRVGSGGRASADRSGDSGSDHDSPTHPTQHTHEHARTTRQSLGRASCTVPLWHVGVRGVWVLGPRTAALECRWRPRGRGARGGSDTGAPW